MEDSIEIDFSKEQLDFLKKKKIDFDVSKMTPSQCDEVFWEMSTHLMKHSDDMEMCESILDILAEV